LRLCSFQLLLLGLSCPLSLVPFVRAHHPVPPSEGGSIVALEQLMMAVMIIRPGPEWHKMTQRPGKVVSRMRIDRLEESQGDPNVNRENMQIFSEETVEKRSADSALRENEYLRVRKALKIKLNSSG